MSDVGVGTRTGTILPPAELNRALERQRGATVGELAGTGDRREVVVPPHLREQLRARVEHRQRTAKALEKDRSRLGTYDRVMLSDRGTELVKRMEGTGPLSADDFALTWALVSDELVQKQGAVDSDHIQAEWLTDIHQELNMQLDRIDRSRIPGIRGLRRMVATSSARVRERVGDIRRRDRTEQRASDRPELTSDYLARSEFLDQSPRAAAEQIIALHKLKIDLETRLGIPQVDPDVWDQPDFRRGKGYELFDTVKQRQTAILQREHGGRLFAELEAQDPFAAERVRHQAIQEGLMHFSTDLARDFLRAERPNISADRIEDEIKRIGSPLEEGSREWKRAKSRLDRAEKQLDRSQTRQNQLEGDVTVQGSVAHLAEAMNNAHTEFTVLDGEVTTVEGNLTTAQGALAVASGATPPDRGEIARQNKIIEDLNNQLANLRPRRSAAGVKEAQATTAHTNANTELTTLSATGTPPPAGSIEAYELTFDTAEDTLNGTPTGEDGERKKALQRWQGLANPAVYEGVVDTLFSQGYEGEFIQETLGAVGLTSSGELAGAELWRRLIHGRSGEMERLMTSNEALARGIMYVFRQDVGRAFQPPRVLPAVGGGTTTFNTYSDLLGEVGARRDAYFAARNTALNTTPPPTAAAVTAACAAERANLLVVENTLLTDLLPMIEHATTFQLADVARFVMNEGLMSAATGDPYLKVRARYETQETERRLTSQAVIGQEMGAITEINAGEGRTGPSFTWEGELGNLDVGDMFQGFPITEDTRYNFRISTQFSGAAGGPLTSNLLYSPRERAFSTIEIEVNESLIQSLPLDVAALNLPEASVFTQFYDRGGLRLPWAVINGIDLFRDPRLRTRNGGGWMEITIPPTTRIDVETAPNPFDTLDPLNALISPDVSQAVTVALANEIVFRRREQDQSRGRGVPTSTDERRRIVQGFRGAEIDYPAVPATITTPAIPASRMVVTMDNSGEFRIQRQEDTGGVFTPVGEQQTLVGFYDRQLAEYQGEPDPIIQQQIQQQIQEIQQAVGEQIFQTQVNR